MRALMRRAETATLATALARDASAHPYASLVLVALDHDAGPLLLISDLADHTRNIEADSRVALLFDGTGGLADPLTGARASVLGRAAPLASERLLARYLARHPSAETYAGFKDFRLHRVAVERAHLVAGFGRIHWLDGAEVLLDCAGAAPLAEAEAGIVEHMNHDHADAVDLIARHILGLEGAGWRLTGVDPEGCDLRRDAALARAPFETMVENADGARAAFVALTAQARRIAGGNGS